MRKLFLTNAERFSNLENITQIAGFKSNNYILLK